MKIQDPSEDFERCMNSNMHLHAWHNTRLMSFSVKSRGQKQSESESGQQQSELLIREWAGQQQSELLIREWAAETET
jgi:hypothetical protein